MQGTSLMKIHSARRNMFSCQGVYSIHEATLGYFRSDPVVSCLLHGLNFYMQLTLQVLIKFTRYWIDIGPEPRSAPRLENCCELLWIAFLKVLWMPSSSITWIPFVNVVFGRLLFENAYCSSRAMILLVPLETENHHALASSAAQHPWVKICKLEIT